MLSLATNSKYFILSNNVVKPSGFARNEFFVDIVGNETLYHWAMPANKNEYNIMFSTWSTIIKWRYQETQNSIILCCVMKEFPKQIPIFPLSGVIYFPKTNLPLNIFEKRYLELVEDIIRKDKLMGMIQSKGNLNEIYKVGCLGKISDYQKSNDGRILINLTGITRFQVIEEIDNTKLYREFKVTYDKFNQDLNPSSDEVNIENTTEKAEIFFKRSGLVLNWKEFDKLNKLEKINTLAMISPITNEEKQKLLEAITLKEKNEILEEIINFYLHDSNYNNQTIQ